MTRGSGHEIAAELGVPDDAFAEYRPRYNVAPMQRYFVLITEFENRKVIPARWGLINRWAKDNSRASQCINAKAETIEARPTFSDAFKKRRCVVPADGFYEWTGAKGNRRPIWFHRADGELILFAGLYEDWFPEQDSPETTFTIITCAANAVIGEIHDRMPVILDERAAEDWMNPREAEPLALKRLLIPARDDALVARPASPLVNSVKNDGPELLVAP